MEKVRLAAQTTGQMLFAQCTEVINPRLNYGLPPNVVVDESSQPFLLKPVDIMIAALQSKLGFLSNPVGTHVQSAEMGNQALNSLGLIPARYTHIALDVLSQLAVAHLFTLCQALDLRAMNCRFLKTLEKILRQVTAETLADIFDESIAFNTQTSEVSPSSRELNRSCADLELEDESKHRDDGEQNDDSSPNSHSVSARPLHAPHHKQYDSQIRSNAPPSPSSHPSSNSRLENLQTVLWKEFSKQLDQTTNMDSAQRFATVFVSLQPTTISFASKSSSNTSAKPGLTTGELITTIYQSIRTGALYRPVMECLAQVEHTG